MPKALERGVDQALVAGTILLEREVKLQATGRAIRVRSGVYRAGISRQINKSAGIGVVGTNVKYAKMQEYGGTVRPKTKKFLTIPIKGSPAETRRAHVGRPARSFFGRFVVLDKTTGQPILYGRTTRSGVPVPLFILRRTVRLKPRRVFGKAFEKAEPEIQALFDASINKALRTVKRGNR